jgi:hypothetical protein
MRASAHPLLVGFAVILSVQVLAQPAEEPEEIVVRAKPLTGIGRKSRWRATR